MDHPHITTAQMNRKFVLDQMHEAIAVISQVVDGEEVEDSEVHKGHLTHDIDTFTVRGRASGDHVIDTWCCRQCWSSHSVVNGYSRQPGSVWR